MPLSLGLAEGSGRLREGVTVKEPALSQPGGGSVSCEKSRVPARSCGGCGHRLPAPRQRLQASRARQRGWVCSISPLLQPCYGLCCAGLTQPPCSGGDAAGVPLQTLLPYDPSASTQPRPELHLLPLQPKRRPCMRSCGGLSPCSAEGRYLLCPGVLQLTQHHPSAPLCAGALRA